MNNTVVAVVLATFGVNQDIFFQLEASLNRFFISMLFKINYIVNKKRHVRDKEGA